MIEEVRVPWRHCLRHDWWWLYALHCAHCVVEAEEG